MGIGDRVHRQPLGRGADSPRDPDPSHEDMGLFPPLPPALGAQVAVVLGVDPVKLGEMRAILRDRAGGRILEVAQDVAAQVMAFRLELLVLVERLGLGFLGGAHRSAPVPSDPTRPVKWQRSAGERLSAARAISARSPSGPAWRPGERKRGAIRTSPELNPGAASASARRGLLKPNSGPSGDSMDAAASGPAAPPSRSRAPSAARLRTSAEMGEGPPWSTTTTAGRRSPFCAAASRTRSATISARAVPAARPSASENLNPPCSLPRAARSLRRADPISPRGLMKNGMNTNLRSPSETRARTQGASVHAGPPSRAPGWIRSLCLHETASTRVPVLLPMDPAAALRPACAPASSEPLSTRAALIGLPPGAGRPRTMPASPKTPPPRR